MLNRAARFFPILRALRSRLPIGGSVLEVGSGSLGLGEFWSAPFVGCDVTFSSPPVKNMRAIQCSGHQLPFRDGAFDAVVVSDVMEHVPPAQRKQVVLEALRVSRRTVIFGYPCGQASFELDQQLYRDYQSRNLTPPGWLEEHMLYPFPDGSLMIGLPAGWTKDVIPNESLRFHYGMMRAEMFRLGNYFFRLVLRIMPAFAERCLRYFDREPSYRMIVVLTFESEAVHV